MVTINALFGVKTAWVVYNWSTKHAEVFRSFAAASSAAYRMRSA